MDAPSKNKHWFRCFKVAVILAVVIGVALTVKSAADEFHAQSIDVWGLNAGWLLLAGISYFVGMLPSAIYYFIVVTSLGGRPSMTKSIQAFYISQLGKYVPGKAMVVVLRAGLVKSDRVSATVAATAVFVETLTWMAVGAALGLALLLLTVELNFLLLGLAAALLVCAAVPTLPPIFRRIVRLLQLDKANRKIEKSFEGLTYWVVAKGWMILVVGWLILGFSLFAVLQAVPGTPPALDSYPLALACVCLAVVAGFVSLLPGGIGVRELVMIPLLSPVFGPTKAIICVILLRLVWLISDLLIVGIIQIAPFLSNRSAGISADASTEASTGN